MGAIEAVDLTGSGANTLVLDRAALLTTTKTSHVLLVDDDAEIIALKEAGVF